MPTTDHFQLNFALFTLCCTIPNFVSQFHFFVLNHTILHWCTLLHFWCHSVFEPLHTEKSLVITIGMYLDGLDDIRKIQIEIT